MHKCIPYELFVNERTINLNKANNLLQNISPYKKEDFL